MTLKFFVFCSHNTSWKSEALHQLCRSLIDLGYPAVMWYTDEDYNNYYDSKTLFKSEYQVSCTHLYKLKDIDKPDCVWIMPEHYRPSFYTEKRNCKRVIWYFDLPYSHQNFIVPNNPALTNQILLFQSKHGLNKANTNCQCLHLTDYISDSLVQSEEVILFENRIKQVIFNNVEGQKHTIALRALMQDVRFIGTSSLNSQTLPDAALKSTVYLDLGPQLNFNKKLKEFTALGCIPIVNGINIGAVKSDLKIADVQRVFPDDSNVYDYELIKEKIQYVFWGNDFYLESNKPFRNIIKNQKQKFYSGTQQLIDLLT